MTAQLKKAFERIDRFLSKEMEKRGIPGLSLGITDRNGLLGVSNIGFADIGPKTRVRDETLFEIGSISKSFASVVALQLVEEGALSLHDPVTSILPWLDIKSKYEPITLHHLMSHTAGIPVGTEITGYGPSEAALLGQFEATAAPGTYFWYSNVGYKIVGLAIEKITGKSFPEAVRERVLKPLGMSRTHAEITHSLRARLAVGYAPRFDDRPTREGSDLVPAMWIESDTADGSISSTASDMCAYIRMLLGAGSSSSGVRLLKKDSFALLTQRAIEPSDAVRGEAYGYGLEVYSDNGHSMIGHTGGMIGFTSAMLMDADLGLGLILLTNGHADNGELARRIMGAIRSEAEGHGDGPEGMDPNRIENAARYSGRFIGDKGTLEVRAEGDRLSLVTGTGAYALKNRLPDGFFAETEELERFLIRPEELDGRIVRLVNGPDAYQIEGTPRLRRSRYPRTWNAYPGHYRTYNPWISNFRVVLRMGHLFLIDPSGHEEPLTPLAKGLFRLGKDERSPERVRFRKVVNGVALEAEMSGCPCYRTFTH